MLHMRDTFKITQNLWKTNKYTFILISDVIRDMFAQLNEFVLMVHGECQKKGHQWVNF